MTKPCNRAPATLPVNKSLALKVGHAIANLYGEVAE